MGHMAGATAMAGTAMGWPYHLLGKPTLQFTFHAWCELQQCY